MTFVEALIQLFADAPLGFGAADIVCADFQVMAKIAAAFYIVMSFMSGKDGKNPVRRIWVILPPESFSTTANETAIKAAIVNLGEQKLGRSLYPGEVSAIEKFLMFVRAEDLTTAAALRALQSAGEHECGIVLHASAYRSETLPESRAHESGPVLPEDQWSSHVVVLAAAAVEYAKRSKCYVMLATGFPVPRRLKNSEMLMSVPDCGVFNMFPEEDAAEILANHLDEWVTKAKAGHLGDVFRSVDGLPPWMDDHKGFIKLQILDMVVSGPQTISMVKEVMASREYLDPFARIKLARAARRGGEPELAHSILGPAVPELNTQEELEVALETAAGDDDLQEKISVRLSALFPQSRGLLAYRLKTLADERAYAAILELLKSTSEPSRSQSGGFFSTIANGLSMPTTPDYEQLVAEVVETDPDRDTGARVLCSREALARGDFANALTILLPEPGKLLSSATARALMRVCFRLLLERRKGGELGLSGEELKFPVMAIVDYLAANPTDANARIRLVDLLGIETTGTLGLSVIVSVVLNTADSSAATQTPNPSGTSESPADWDLSSFLKRAYEWWEMESPLILHMTSLPIEVLRADPNFVLDEMRDLLRYDQDLRDDPSAEAFEKLVYIAALVAPLSDRPNEDIDIIRFAAARFVAANRLQKARDLAEQALLLAGSDELRRRLGWLAFADIYHRCHNTIESLIALACMFSIRTNISVEDLWQEGFLLFRVLRDLRFIEAARSVVKMLRDTLERTYSPEDYGRRLTTMELGIEVAALNLAKMDDDSQLRALTKQVADHCEDMLEHRDDPSPSLSLLAHCIHLAKFRGYQADEAAANTLMKGTERAPAPIMDLLAAVSEPTPDASQLISLLKTLETARYHEDVAFDVNQIGIAARRLLDIPLGNEDAGSAMIAIEAGSDHGIRRQTGRPSSWFVSREAFLECAGQIAALGYQLLFMGLSESGLLVRVQVDADGALRVAVEDRATFNGTAFHRWTHEYPYQYPDSDDSDVFIKTTESMRVTFQPISPVILVLDTKLQQLPPNMFRIGDQFWGEFVPVCSVPSLSWLANNQNIAGGTPGKLRAWIPSEPGLAKDAVLDYLVKELEAPLASTGVELFLSSDLPDDFSGSELAILAAHGGVLPKGEYFQVISDNATLSIYPEMLASTVRGSNVVVLFMCSGGRVDSHPHAQTTVGLVKQLFDHGCSTVIACPWPLDARVAANWAPVFLQRWNEGATAAEASFHANRHIANVFAGKLVDCLAMNVYGDPFRTKVK
jgi:hypothetical protein